MIDEMIDRATKSPAAQRAPAQPKPKKETPPPESPYERIKKGFQKIKELARPKTGNGKKRAPARSRSR